MTRQRTLRYLALNALLTVTALGLTSIAQAQFPCTAMCNPTATAMGGKLCYATALCTNANYPNPVAGGTGVMTSVSAMCSAGMPNLMGKAIHYPGSGANSGTMANCGFYFTGQCANATGTGIPYSGTCNVTFADGLPVELIQFSVDQ